VKNLERRLSTLETQQRVAANSFDHLSDGELEAHTLALIEEIATAGIELPSDWRERYDASAVRFLGWLQERVTEALAYED
jgi:hypothetical protein